MEKVELLIPIYQKDHIPETTNYHKKNKKTNFKLQNLLSVLAFVFATGFLILSYSFFLLPASPPEITLRSVVVRGFYISSSSESGQVNLHHWGIPFTVENTDENRILDFEDFTISVLYKQKINISSVTLEPFRLHKRPVTIEPWPSKNLGFNKRFGKLKTSASSVRLPDKSVAESAVAELDKGAMRFTFQFSARMTSRLLWRAVTKQVSGSCEEMEVEFDAERNTVYPGGARIGIGFSGGNRCHVIMH